MQTCVFKEVYIIINYPTRIHKNVNVFSKETLKCTFLISSNDAARDFRWWSIKNPYSNARFVSQRTDWLLKIVK